MPSTVKFEDTGFDENGQPYRRTITITDNSPAPTLPRSNEVLVIHDYPTLQLSNHFPYPSLGGGAGAFGLQQPPQAPEREADQWLILQDPKGKTYYFNQVTWVEQYAKPDCLKKYSAM